MGSLNYILTLAVMFCLHGFILGLTCLTCKGCDEETEVPIDQECSGNNVYCISYVDDFKKITKRCGTQEECERVGKPSVDPNQFIANMKSFVNGSMGYDVATLDESSFWRNYSYCCDSDSCTSQTLNIFGHLDKEGNSLGATVDGIVNSSNSMEENFKYITGYNSPRLRSRLNHDTTLTSVNSRIGEKRSMKRSPDAAGEGNPADGGEDAVTMDTHMYEKNANLSLLSLIPSTRDIDSSTVAETTEIQDSQSLNASTKDIDSSTVVETTVSQDRAEAVSGSVIVNCVGKYIVILYSILYIFW